MSGFQDYRKDYHIEIKDRLCGAPINQSQLFLFFLKLV